MEEFLFIGEAEGGRKKFKSLQANPPEITASFLERLSLLVAINTNHQFSGSEMDGKLLLLKNY